MSEVHPNQFTVVRGIVLNELGQVALAQRSGSCKRNAGKIEFAGGQLDANETQEECLAREAREEFNLQVLVDPTESPYTQNITISRMMTPNVLVKLFF